MPTVPTLAIVPTDGELDELVRAFLDGGCAVETKPFGGLRGHFVKEIDLSLAQVPRFPGAALVLDRCRTASWSAGLRVHLGGIASGDEDVVSEARRAECRRTTWALAVAWEGAGGAHACAFAGVPYLEIRAVADAANEDGPRDFALNLNRAMRNLTQVLRIVAG